MRSRLWSLLLVPLLLGAGQPIDPRTLAWDSSGGPDIVAGYEVVQSWDGTEATSTVTGLSVPLAARTGTAYAARVRALPVDPGAYDPSPWSTLAAEWPDAIAQITSLSQLGRTTAPLPGEGQVMAVAGVGSVITVDASAASGSTSITIPDGTNYLLIGVGCWNGSSTVTTLSAGAITIGGVSATALVSFTNGDGGLPSTIFGVANSGTGSQTFAWDWSGTDSLDEGGKIHIRAYSGVDTADPVRASSAVGLTQVLQSLSLSSASVEVQTGDVLFAYATVYQTNAVTISWTNATELTESATYNSHVTASAESTTAATYTVTATRSEDLDWMGLAVVVLRAGSGATALPRRALDGPFYGALRGSVR
jgi:hypothetical protein